ncbi:MAG: c-type cytochrome [Thermoguttaceae bacterium]
MKTILSRVVMVGCLLLSVVAGVAILWVNTSFNRSLAQWNARTARRPAESQVASRPATFPGANDQWQHAGDAAWIAVEKSHHEIKAPANNKSVLAKESQRDGSIYGNYTEEDLLRWERETERMVVEGSKIFHSADLLGSTIAVSCDMCHPDASGTHPETYPKYQVQLGRPALLRDMINWCLTQPCRGEPLSGDDPRMRAMEAYIQAQRTGVPMKYGKH